MKIGTQVITHSHRELFNNIPGEVRGMAGNKVLVQFDNGQQFLYNAEDVRPVYNRETDVDWPFGIVLSCTLIVAWFLYVTLTGYANLYIGG